MIKTVLYISNDSINVYQGQYQVSGLVCTLLWSDKSGIEGLLAELPSKSSVSIIFDLLEEGITVEVFPKLFLWEKRTVREQHIHQQLAEGACFVNATWTRQVHNSSGTPEISLLTTSIPSSAFLTHFMSSLEDAQIMLTGVYSASFLLASYFKQDLASTLDLNKEQLNLPQFLISRQSENVYRQTFLNQSAVHISRLISIDHNEGLSEQILIGEAKLAQNYLYNQGVISTEETVSYVFMDSGQKRLEKIEALSLALGFTQSTMTDSHAFFKTIDFNSYSVGNGDSTEGHYAGGKLADYLFRRSPPSFFNPFYVRKVNNLQRGARSLLAVNSLILSVLLIYITASLVDVYIGQERLQRIEQSVTNYQAEETRLQKRVKHQVDAEVLKATVELSESIITLKSDRTLGIDVKTIAKVVAQQAEHIQLIKLDWKQQGQIDSARYEIKLEGLVYPFTDYYQDPVRWVDDFKDALAHLGSVIQVEIIKEPLNRDLKQALTIVANKARERVNALPFQIRLEVVYEPSE